MMRCQAKTKNGERCRNQAREGEELCGIHAAPDAVRTAWASRGGRTSTRATVEASRPYTDLGPSEWTQWARAQCASALEAVRDGRADARTAHAIAALAGQVMRATEQEELRREVEALTAEVADLKARRENAA